MRRLSYKALLTAVPKLAAARGCTPAEIVRRLAACDGPTRTATTTPENVRLSERGSFCGEAQGGPGGAWCMGGGWVACAACPPPAGVKACWSMHLWRPQLPPTRTPPPCCRTAGIAARGGPTVVEKRVTLEAAVDRSRRRSALVPYVE